jgi:hypothetical protein
MAGQSSTAINYGVHKMASKRKLKIQIKGAKEEEEKKKTIKFHRLPGRSQWLGSMRSHTAQTGGSPASTRA